MQQSENKNFTAQDIERYYSGKMAAQEMHGLEKAALDDPFLADALEGYQFATTPVEDIQKIKERLQKKTEEKKAIPLKQYTWLKVAAVLFLIAGGSWLMVKMLSTENKSVAVVTQKGNSNNKLIEKQTADTIASNEVVQSNQGQKLKSEITKPAIRKKQRQIKEKA